KAFYVRRTLRIFPAFYVYLVSIAILSAADLVVVRRSDLIFGATYTINYVVDRSWVLGHLWSLAVEEQFYLLWPTVLVFGRHRARMVASVVVLLAPLFRIAMWYLLPEHEALIGKAFPTIADAIAVGCLLALHRERLGTWRPYA